MNKNFKVGIILVVIGAFLLLTQLNIFSGPMFLSLLGVGFLVVYFLMGGRKNYGNLGFLIPGLILLALAVFTSETISQHPSLFFFLLSLVFLVVLFAHTFWFTGVDWGTRFWPIFPAAGLMLFSGYIYGVTVLNWSFFNLANYLIPLIIIVIGITLILKKGTGK